MTNNDYGFYGSGLDGYVHYKQSFDRTHDIASAPTRSVFDATFLKPPHNMIR